MSKCRPSRPSLVLEILGDGKLDGAANHREGMASANYLMLENEFDGYFHDKDITLHFENSLLDRDDYYLNSGWAFGLYNRGSIRHVEQSRLRPFLFHYGKGHAVGWDNHELVFLEPIGLEQLNYVEVPARRREAILAKIKKAGLRPPRGKSWGEIIVEKAKPETLPGWMTNY